MAVPKWTDYSWINDEDLVVDLEVCCLTLISNATVEEVIRALPPVRDEFAATYAELDERMMAEGGGGPHVAGLVQSGSAVVIFEPNGWMGTDEKSMGPVSVGRNVAAYYYGGHGVSGFYWYADGSVRVNFEPAQPLYRHDPEYIPAPLVEQMENIGGFCFYDSDPDDLPEADWDAMHPTEASLALGEALTGVRVTKPLLRDSSYRGCVIDPNS